MPVLDPSRYVRLYKGKHGFPMHFMDRGRSLTYGRLGLERLGEKIIPVNALEGLVKEVVIFDHVEGEV